MEEITEKMLEAGYSDIDAEEINVLENFGVAQEAANHIWALHKAWKK